MEPREIFEKAYDILVEHAGAPAKDFWGESFIQAFVTRPLAMEWRFGGKLGFGGKFWRNDNRYYVSCYREDRTAERERTIEEVNRLLATLPYYEPPPV